MSSMKYNLRPGVPGSSRNLQVESIKGIRLGAILDFNNLMLEEDSLQIRTTLFRNRGKTKFSNVQACIAKRLHRRVVIHPVPGRCRFTAI